MFVSCTQLSFSSSTNNVGKHENPASRFWATNIDTVSLSIVLSFLHHSLYCPADISIDHTLSFSAISFVPLSHSPPSLSLTPSSLPPASNWPTLYKLQPKMMSLIIWAEIMWLSFSLCVSAGPCVHAHVSLCVRAHLTVYVRVHCIDACIIIFRQEWRTSMWAIYWLHFWPTGDFYWYRTNIKALLFDNWQKESTVHSSCWDLGAEGQDSRPHVEPKTLFEVREKLWF